MADCDSVIHVINLHGDNLIGAEIGVEKGKSFCTLLQSCQNIKELHGIDSWQPYADYLGQPYGEPHYVVFPVEAEINKAIAQISAKHLNVADKAHWHEMDSNQAAKLFPDEHFDFIFLDTYLTIEQIANDINVWYPKVKKGGLFIGHDWNFEPLQEIIHRFRRQHNITNKLSCFDNTYLWIKQ